MTALVERLRALTPPWIKDAGDVFVTVGIVGIVLVASALTIQNRHTARDAKVLAAQVHEHQQAEARSAVQICYERRAGYLALRPVILSLARSSPSARVRKAARDYLATLRDTTPRLSDCHLLADSLGVPQ